MDISWTLLFTLCLYGNLVSGRKKHKRSHSVHNDDANAKLKKTKQFIFQAMLKRPQKVKRHVSNELNADPTLQRKVIRNFNAEQIMKRHIPFDLDADIKEKPTPIDRKAKRQIAFGFNTDHKVKHQDVFKVNQKAKRHATPVFKVNVIANHLVPFFKEQKAKRQAPVFKTDGKVDAAHLLLNGRNFIKMQVSIAKKHKRSLSIHQDDNTELRRTKRNLYRALLMRRRIGKRQVPTNFNIDMMGMPRSPIARPMVKGQVQVVNFEIKVSHDWRDEMYNVSSPEYELLVGNIVDAFANELTADYNFHSSAVTKLRKAERNHWILADVATRFYKTEANPLHHLQGIISKGWVSGQRVDPEYFILLGILNGNKEIQKIKFPQKLKLRLVPPHIETSTPTPPPPPSENETGKVQKTLRFKEIRISIKLKQLYGMFLSDRKSPEFKELGGNLEQAIYKIFSRDSFFIGTKTLGFRESPEGRCIAVIAIDFKTDEKYAIEKMQAMISGGDLAGMPVDDTYLIVNSLSEVHLNGTVKSANQQTNPLVHRPNATASKDVSTSVPISSTYSYQAKTFTPSSVVTTSPPEARSNVTVSEAKLAQKSPAVETSVNSNQSALLGPPEIPQNTSAPIVEVVDTGALIPQNATIVPIPPQAAAAAAPKPEATQPQVDQVSTNVDNATLISPTFKPAVESLAMVNSTSQVTSPETNPNEIKYLVTSPGVVVAELPLQNDSVVNNAPSGGKTEPKAEETSTTVKLIKGAKLTNETAPTPNVIQIPLIPLAALQGTPTAQNQPAVLTNVTGVPQIGVPQIVSDAANFLPSLATLTKNESQALVPTVLQAQNVSSVPVNISNIPVIYNTTSGQTYPPNIPPVIPVQPVAPVMNQPLSTEATSKLLSPFPQVPLTSNLTTYPGWLPASLPLQPAPLANLTIPVNVNIIPPGLPPSVDIAAQLIKTPETPEYSSGVPLANVSETVPLVEINATIPLYPSHAAVSNTTDSEVPLANVSQPYDIGTSLNTSLQNIAKAPEGSSQTPALFPQPMSKLTGAPSVIPVAANLSTSLENESTAATLIPQSNASLLPAAQEIPAVQGAAAPTNATVSAAAPSTKDAQVTPNAIITPEVSSAPILPSQLLPILPVGILAVQNASAQNANLIPITVAPNAPYKRPTVNQIISSLLNASSGVPTVNEAAVTSDVINAPENNTEVTAPAEAPSVQEEAPAPATPVEAPAPASPVEHAAPASPVEQAAPASPVTNAVPALLPYQRRPSVADIISSLTNSTLNASVNVPEANPILVSVQNASAPVEVEVPVVPVPVPGQETVSAPETPKESPAQVIANTILPVLAEAVATNISSIQAVQATPIKAFPIQAISNVTSVAQPSPALPINPEANEQTAEVSPPLLEKETSAPLQYKGVLFAIRVYHPWEEQLAINDSVAYVELSALVEQAIDNVLVPKDPFYVDVGVQEFLKDPEKITIAHIMVRFLPEELHPIEVIQSTIKNGNLTGVTLDKDFFFVLSTDEEVSPEAMRNETLQNAQTYLAGRKLKPKPLMFKEIRFTLRLIEPWNISFANNNSMAYAVFSGMVEQAVDRGLMSDSNYIDSTVLELEKDHGNNTLVYVAVRFRIQEEDLEKKLVTMIQNGSLSGIPLDKNFFEVFSLSETHHPNIGLHVKPPDEVPLLTLAEELIAGVTNGQKQSATNDGVKTKGNETQVVNASAAVSPAPITAALTYNDTTTQQLRTDLPLYTSSEDNGPDEVILPTATAPPNIVQSVASDRVVTIAPSVNMKTTVTMAPPDLLDALTLSTLGLPTETPYATTPLPMGSSSNIATELPGGSALNHIEGSMTLQQKWHPYLTDKTSNEYKLLEETVISEIKNAYGQINEEVIPQIISFTETQTPATPIHNMTDTEISVHFKVMFLPGHESNSALLKTAIESNSLGDLVLYPNSFVLKSTDTSLSTNKYTSCQQLHATAVSASDGQIGGFIPECTPDGNFKPVQCHALTGFCWCVNHIGVRIVGTEERYKEPSCEGINLSGDITLPVSAPSPLPAGSCLVIQTKSWNPAYPIIGNMTVMEPDVVNNTMSYEMHIPDIDPGAYILRCILHLGQCNLADNKPRAGDYYMEKKYEVSPDTTEVEEDLALVEQTEHSKDVNVTIVSPTIAPIVPILAVESAGPPAGVLLNSTATQPPIQTSAPANQTVVAPAAVSPPALSAPALATASAPESAAPSPSTLAIAAPSESASPVIALPVLANATSSASPAGVSNKTGNLTSTASDGEFDYQFTLLTNPNYIDPANRTEEDKYMVQTGLLSTNSSTSPMTNASDPLFIALPNGLPKSCQGIRDSGIGNLDGQYIIEARPGCHISVICVNMNDENTKEFLGGPSEAEWKYWHYAVLIKISESDKRNIPQGACLEFSDQGKELLHRIMVAGAREGSPISKWKTKISNIIRRKRNLPKKVSIITKPKLIRINKEQKNKMWTSK